MANEARIQASLQIRKTNSDGSITLIDYQSRPTVFLADVDGTFGPSPGTVACSTLGTDIDLSQLTQPGFCWIMNLDDENFVEVGIRDPEQDRFYPFFELGPGEFTVYKFSRNFAEEYYPATGTGTTAATNLLMIRANTASCSVSIQAFES